MKKIRLIALLLIALVVLSAKSSVAQDSTFKLSDYKNPNYFYQTLDLNFILNSSSDGNKNDNTSDYYLTNRYSLSSNAKAHYSSYANSNKSQSEFGATLYGSVGTGTNHETYQLTNQEHKDNSSSTNENLDISGLKRFYNEKQFYFEVNGSVSNSFSGSSGKNKDFHADTLTASSKTNSNSFGTSVWGAFLLGNGRIEQVQDARLALYMLEDMKRLNRDQRSASNEEVLELAKLITSLKYKRFFDDRLKKIAEITAIDSFLQKTGLVRIPDAAYFTSLNDNWDYSNNTARESGYHIYIGVEGHYRFENYKFHREITLPIESISDGKHKTNQAEIYGVAGLVFEKPINLKWQQSAYLKASAGSTYWFNKNSLTGYSDTSNYNGSIPYLRVTAGYGYGFYPNSRTSITVSWFLSSTYDKQFLGASKKNKENSRNSFNAYTGPGLHAYYYISEKLRLSINFSGLYSVNYDEFITNIPAGSDDNQTKTHWGNQLDASLTYILF